MTGSVVGFLKVAGPAVASLVVGTTAVGAIAKAVANTAIDQPFGLNVDRFDQNTFVGRWKKMVVGLDPSTLIATEREAMAAKDMLQRYAEGERIHDDATLFKARALRDACFGSEPSSPMAVMVPPCFRMAGYVPFNGPIIVAMTVAQSNPAIIFWQVMNQTQNALVNYFNRNLSAPFSMFDLGKSYTTAVVASTSVAFGLSFFIKKRYPMRATKLLRFVAFPSCVTASTANCWIMRRPEISQGWELFDEDGNTVADGARSSIAAAEGVYSTVVSRGLLQVPAVAFPALFTALPAISMLIKTHPVLNLPLTTLSCLLSFGVGLPASLALFPQIAEIDTSKLEPEFQNLVYENGDPITKLYYNKGL
jgi:tricarboxylate carrier|eukprot:Stramenopile-MAST_4_protein_4235